MRLYKFINHFPFNNRKKGRLHIDNNGAILWHCKIISSGKGNQLILRRGVYLNCEFIFYGNNNTIEFGDRCIAKNASFYTEDDNNLIKTGNKVMYAGKIHIACTESTKCIIGNDCLFSSEIVIRTGDSHSILDENQNRINQAKDITIDNHIWVGHRVLITKGVTIAPNCVIGTGAILTKKVDQSNTILAGVPAKIVKENINWCGERL